MVRDWRDCYVVAGSLSNQFCGAGIEFSVALIIFRVGLLYQPVSSLLIMDSFLSSLLIMILGLNLRGWCL